MFEQSTQSTEVYNSLKIQKPQSTMKISNKWATWLFIAGIVGARIAMGLFFNVTGPTLPTLSKNVDVPGKGQIFVATYRILVSILTRKSLYNFLDFYGSICSNLPRRSYIDQNLQSLESVDNAQHMCVGNCNLSDGHSNFGTILASLHFYSRARFSVWCDNDRTTGDNFGCLGPGEVETDCSVFSLYVYYRSFPR